MSENFKYKRGSKWRKWDLHIHTPASFFWRGGKKLNDLSDVISDGEVLSEKEKEIKKFIDQINNSDVEVFCITDYWTFDWYNELRKYLLKYPNELKKTIFPGMELRVECPVDYRLNISVILSDNLTAQQLNDFKSELIIRAINRKLSNESLKEFAKTLDESKARHHGYDNPNSLDEDKLLELGSKTAEITKDSLAEAFKHIPANSGFVILPYDTSDGLLKLDWKKHPQDDNYFMQTAKIIETRDSKNVDLFNGLKTENNKDFFNNFFKTIGDKPKPCISGSDAHNFSDYGKFPSDRITWIKADPTFEGLKQIIFEPIDRVKIQELKPEEKEGYYVINSINFVDDNFTPEIIPVNQNLTAIIGGKSTGKSILLRNIAKTIDVNEVESRLNEVGLSDYDQEVNGFEVVWNDSEKDKKNELSETPRKIIYIPQSYLNRLVDKKEDKTSIDDIIKNVIKQDSYVNSAFNNLDSEIREIEKSITTNIDNLFYTIKDIKTQTETIKGVGDKKGITEEITKLEKEVDVLKKKAGMTTDQINEYNSLLESINILNKEKEKIESNIKTLELISEEGVNINFDLFVLPESIKESLVSDFEILKNEFTTKWIDKVNIHITSLRENLKKKKADIVLKNNQFVPLLEKAKENNSLKEKISRLENEKQKLSSIVEQETKLNNLKLERNKILAELVVLQGRFYDDSFKTKSEILKQTVIDGEISFGLDILFRQNTFQENFVKEVLNLQKINRFSDVCLSEYKYVDNTTFKQNVEKIILGILEEKIALKINYSQKEAITKLLQNWYIFDYRIKQNQDEISQMSPGKKSFVLLKLLIELDRSKCPILLDQPEDDLDNRSIYYDLVDFIKNKKKERQIIIATHNPNLVVGSDAECVIVANQKGEKTPNKEYDFEYVSGSLENTFEDKTEKNILYSKGIKEHTCDVLEGGKEAFNKREQKYDFNIA